MLVENPNEKFIMAYSDNPDGLLHKYGTDSVEVSQYIIDTEKKIQSMCDKLPNDSLKGYTQENIIEFKEFKKNLKSNI